MGRGGERGGTAGRVGEAPGRRRATEAERWLTTKVSLKDAKMWATPNTFSPSLTFGPMVVTSSTGFSAFLVSSAILIEYRDWGSKGVAGSTYGRMGAAGCG